MRLLNSNARLAWPFDPLRPGVWGKTGARHLGPSAALVQAGRTGVQPCLHRLAAEPNWRAPVLGSLRSPTPCALA